MKTKKVAESSAHELNRFGDPATTLSVLGDLVRAMDRNTAAVQDAANALWAIKKRVPTAKDCREDAGGLGIIYHGGAEAAKRADTTRRIESAKKTLSRKKT